MKVGALNAPKQIRAFRKIFYIYLTAVWRFSDVPSGEVRDVQSNEFCCYRHLQNATVVVERVALLLCCWVEEGWLTLVAESVYNRNRKVGACTFVCIRRIPEVRKS